MTAFIAAHRTSNAIGVHLLESVEGLGRSFPHPRFVPSIFVDDIKPRRFVRLHCVLISLFESRGRLVSTGFCERRRKQNVMQRKNSLIAI